jgi:hypothetical protein
MERLSKIPRYRDAFEAAVAKVDWDTEFIHPLIAGCWTGYTWELRKQENLPGLNDFFDPLIEEWVGLRRPSVDSRERGTVRRNLVLLELACERSEDPTRRGRWERSHLLELDDGTVYQAVTLRPAEGVPGFGVLHDSAAPFTVAEALVEPRPINPLIRWDKGAARPVSLSGKALACAHVRARTTFEPVLAPFRRQLEQPSAPRHAVVLIRPERIGRVGGRIVLEDVRGDRLVAIDLHVGDRNVANLVRAAGMMPAPTVLVRLHYRPIPYGVVAQPLAALTAEHHLRLGL